MRMNKRGEDEIAKNEMVDWAGWIIFIIIAIAAIYFLIYKRLLS